MDNITEEVTAVKQVVNNEFKDETAKIALNSRLIESRDNNLIIALSVGLIIAIVLLFGFNIFSF